MDFWALGTFWFVLAIIADFASIRLKISVALLEIVVGMLAAFFISFYLPSFKNLGADQNWIVFLASTGAVLLTFLAGAELDPAVVKADWKKVLFIGLIGFFAPFFGCAFIAHYALGWSTLASLLAGVALSTTSVAVVYAVMLELGLNKTRFGKTILAACFVNDLGTVIALGMIFAPFSYKTIVFIVVSLIVLFFLPRLTRYVFKLWGGRHSELESKFLFIFLFGLGALAYWAGSEPVLPAYIIGMLLACILEKDHMLVRRLRAITFGLLTPFYFLRAGSLVSLPAIWVAPSVFIILFLAKMITKVIGVYPAAKLSKYPKKEAIYTTLLMSTGLTFGTISALFGLSHNIINESQYSNLVATVIASAVIPTLIANIFFLPKHLLPPKEISPELPES